MLIDTSHPCWTDFRDLLAQLSAESFPDAAALNRLMPPGLVNREGKPVRFTPAGNLPGVDYEKHIFEAGEVSTREDNWHDLFNALVWCRLPRMKAAMNALHYEYLGGEKDGRRGSLRDALTLLDESGVLVVSGNRKVLQALAARDWHRAFFRHGPDWNEQLRVIVCGHALLEKFLRPYKAVTAHALLLQIDESNSGPAGEIPLHCIDSWAARELQSGRLLNSPADLSPLPLMGIPGWWGAQDQDEAFYADRSVFRIPPANFHPAPVKEVCERNS